MNDSIAISFAFLVKDNNGFFKSEKQAKFLLSRCTIESGQSVYVTSGHHWQGFSLWYYCDDKGITKVVKNTRAKGDVITWERPEEGKVTVQEKREVRQITRNNNQLIRRYGSIEAGKAALLAEENQMNESAIAMRQSRISELKQKIEETRSILNLPECANIRHILESSILEYETELNKI